MIFVCGLPAMVSARRLTCVLLATHGAALTEDRHIPEFKGVESLMFADYVRLTQGLTMPAIIKGFFDPAVPCKVLEASS